MLRLFHIRVDGGQQYDFNKSTSGEKADKLVKQGGHCIVVLLHIADY